MSDSFRTKTGHATVTREQIVIERTGPRGRAANMLQGNSKSRTLLIYGILFAMLVWSGWSSWNHGSTVAAVLFWAYGGWIAYALTKARNFTMSPIMERAATSRIEGIRGLKGATRDRIVVSLSEGGREVRRFILMPGALQNGAGELDRALALLSEQGWPVDPDSEG